jgi:hypothetical protein
MKVSPYSGIRGETVTDVSQRLLAEHGGLRDLFRMDFAELARIRELGDAKAVRLKAALELGRRLVALSPEERPQVGSLEDVANLLQIELAAVVSSPDQPCHTMGSDESRVTAGKEHLTSFRHWCLESRQKRTYWLQACPDTLEEAGLGPGGQASPTFCIRPPSAKKVLPVM